MQDQSTGEGRPLGVGRAGGGGRPAGGYPVRGSDRTVGGVHVREGRWTSRGGLVVRGGPSPRVDCVGSERGPDRGRGRSGILDCGKVNLRSITKTYSTISRPRPAVFHGTAGASPSLRSRRSGRRRRHAVRCWLHQSRGKGGGPGRRGGSSGILDCRKKLILR